MDTLSATCKALRDLRVFQARLAPAATAASAAKLDRRVSRVCRDRKANRET